MSLSGIGNPGISRPTVQLPIRDGGVTQRPRESDQAGRLRAPAAPAAPAQNAPAAANGLPVEPPPGTDPALWSVLSSEERGYFAKAGAMGPLTYGRVMQELKANPLPASRGGRLDVKI